MNNLKQAMADVLRIVLVVALPVILILILLILYHFMWPSSLLNTGLTFPKQSKMTYQGTDSKIIHSYLIISKNEDLQESIYAKPNFISDI